MKYIIHILLAPIFIPPMLFMYVVHNWKDGESLMENLIKSRNPLRWSLFAVLSVVVFPIMLFMDLSFKAWEDLQD